MPRVDTGAREPALDGLRGFAVCLTFLVHFAAAFSQARLGKPIDQLLYATRDPLEVAVSWLFISQHGVYLFFLLSGLLIWQKLSQEPSSAGRFFGQRALRILPAAWASLLAMAVVGALTGGRWPTAGDWLLNAAFLNGVFAMQVRPINFVTWSLFIEWCFYLLAPLLVIIANGLRAGALALGLATGLLAVVLAWVHPMYGAYVAAFAAGAGLVKRLPGWVPTPRRDAILAGAFMVYAAMPGLVVPLPLDGGLETISPAMRLYALYVAGFALVGAVLVRRLLLAEGLLYQAFASRPFRSLGRISFSLFLMHPAILTGYYSSRTAEILRMGEEWSQLAVDLGVTFIGSVLVAIAWFRVFEAPYFRLVSTIPKTINTAPAK